MGLADRLAACVIAAAAIPQAAFAQSEGERRSAGGDIFFSTDSDDSEILRTGLDLDVLFEGPNKRRGVRVERAWYNPQGSGTVVRDRIFLQAADVTGGWTWNARVGTDGDTVIGAASIHDDAKFRKEFFIERDIVETRQGLDRGIYATFAGAAVDLPLDDRNSFTVLAGVQEFTGKNVRFHARANYVHVIKPEWGLSAQLRTRYFHSTEPAEFDYYSPRWYAQVLPAIQVRRFVSGWELAAVGGVGAQRDSDSKWRRSEYAQIRFRSPSTPQMWSAFGEVTYSNSPTETATADTGYQYLQTMFGLARRF